jgi:prepilin-type N-terminal cleavage/methylation domain-containing protein
MKTVDQNSGFTLIELLIVIAIAAVLMVLTLPSFLEIGRGSKMEAAVSQLNSTINLARQWAITHRETVHIIFPDDWNVIYSSSGTNHYQKALRSYVVYAPSKGYVSEWRYLPGGIYFVDTYNSPIVAEKAGIPNIIDPGKNIFKQSNLTNLPFPTAASSTPQINALTIKPDGQILRFGATPAEIYLCEGIPFDGSGGKVVNLTWKKNPVTRGIQINPFTGLTRLIDFTQLAPQT